MKGEGMQKTCSHCRVEKPDSEFYERNGGGTVSWCKQCMKEHARAQSSSPKLNAWESRIHSENVVIDELRRAGIWAQTGKSCSAPFVDVVARGCVHVEVKYARINQGRGGEFTFNTTPMQARRGLLADVVVLVCDYENDEPLTFHVFPANHAVFYMRDERTGKRRLKSGLVYKPVRNVRKHDGNRVVMTRQLMEQARNAWELIDNAQAVIENRIQSGQPAHEYEE